MLPPKSLTGRSLLKSGRHSPEFYVGMWRDVSRDNTWQGEVWNRRKSGEVFVVWLSIGRVARARQPVRFVVTLIDITRSKSLEQELRHRAYHDPLTDLPNRTLFIDRLRVVISQTQCRGHRFALCYIDLDSSSRSMTNSDMLRVTNCWSRRRAGCAAACALRIRSRGWAAMSLPPF